ncbi:MAG: ATP-binding cassette domain-containing protein, partial [Bradymonadaceae bacterium]
QAADVVHARELIESYDDGLEHAIDERGSNLSAGEQQLFAFARGMVRSPEVLVLDEATASVDTDTEALIQEAVDALLDHQTSLVIAHRLSTIESSDRILVVDDGRIVERGDHEELLARNGHYAKLYELQYASPDEVTGGDEETPVPASAE